MALAFCNRVHHAAHERYAGLVAEAVWPDIPASQVPQFLDLVETVWGIRYELAEADNKRKREQSEE